VAQVQRLDPSPSSPLRKPGTCCIASRQGIIKRGIVFGDLYWLVIGARASWKKEVIRARCATVANSVSVVRRGSSHCRSSRRCLLELESRLLAETSHERFCGGSRPPSGTGPGETLLADPSEG
jgi:hypothetical protein